MKKCSCLQALLGEKRRIIYNTGLTATADVSDVGVSVPRFMDKSDRNGEFDSGFAI